MHSLTFNALECCALVHAFPRSPHKLARWSAALGGLRLFAGILVRTQSMTFELTPDLIALYRSFARTELRFLALAQGNHRTARLRCRHSIDDHEQALHAILDRLPRSN